MRNDTTLRDLRSLGIAQALYKKLGEIVSTKEPDSLRSQIDNRLRDLYESQGTDRLRIILNDEEFGTVSARLSKKAIEQRVQIDNPSELMHDDYELMAQFVAQHKQDYADWVFETQGVVPAGCQIVEREMPGGQFLGTTLRGCNPEDLERLLGVGIEEAVVTGLLGSGEDGDD